MSDHKYARGLLDAAEEDIRALRALLGTDVGDGVFGFHVQQAAEKSFKAWLALLDVRFPLTHDLGVLMGLLQQTVDAAVFTPLRVYTPFAVQFAIRPAIRPWNGKRRSTGKQPCSKPKRCGGVSRRSWNGSPREARRLRCKPALQHADRHSRTPLSGRSSRGVAISLAMLPPAALPSCILNGPATS